ncbi:MAG: type II toxin-antitoxin system HicA family toxin [Bacteroidales bacterium]|nr:type II toxin-antitoxin system HicA family toxin [Bacteroidales bacterium]
MKTTKNYELVELLKQNGWKHVRPRGDHHIFKKEGATRPIVVPGNRNDDLAEGTLNSILRAAGLK